MQTRLFFPYINSYCHICPYQDGYFSMLTFLNIYMYQNWYQYQYFWEGYSLSLHLYVNFLSEQIFQEIYIEEILLRLGEVNWLKELEKEWGNKTSQELQMLSAVTLFEGWVEPSHVSRFTRVWNYFVVLFLGHHRTTANQSEDIFSDTLTIPVTRVSDLINGGGFIWW